MHPKNLKNAQFVVGLKPASIQCVSPDGELLWALGLTPGLHAFPKMAGYAHPTDIIEMVGDVVGILPDGARLSPQPAQAVIETGANPDFRPANYTEAEIRLRSLLKEVEAKSDSLERREKSFKAASTTQKAKAPNPEPEKPEPKKPDPVLETTTDDEVAKSEDDAAEKSAS